MQELGLLLLALPAGTNKVKRVEAAEARIQQEALTHLPGRRMSRPPCPYLSSSDRPLLPGLTRGLPNKAPALHTVLLHSWWEVK